MSVIDKLSEKVADEMRDANEYAHMALEYRETCPTLAKTLHEISMQEAEHMERLSKAASEQIKAEQALYREG